MKWSRPKSNQSVLFNPRFDIIQVTIPGCQGKVCNVYENSIRQILHSSGHCLHDATVESDQVIKFFNSLMQLAGCLSFVFIPLNEFE